MLTDWLPCTVRQNSEILRVGRSLLFLFVCFEAGSLYTSMQPLELLELTMFPRLELKAQPLLYFLASLGGPSRIPPTAPEAQALQPAL